MYVENQITSLSFSSNGQVRDAQLGVPKTNGIIKQQVNLLHLTEY